MDQDDTRHEDGPRSRPHCARWGPSSPPKMGQRPQFTAHIDSAQMAGRIKMSLGKEVGLCPGDIVLDGDPVPPPLNGHRGGRAGSPSKTKSHGPRPTAISSGILVHPAVWPQRTLAENWEAEPPIFGPCLLWTNGWMDQDATWFGGKPLLRRRCVRRDCSSPLKKGVHRPVFGPCVLKDK